MMNPTYEIRPIVVDGYEIELTLFKYAPVTVSVIREVPTVVASISVPLQDVTKDMMNEYVSKLKAVADEDREAHQTLNGRLNRVRGLLTSLQEDLVF